MNLATINQYATALLALLSLFVVLVPLLGNGLSAVLRSFGRVDAARKIDAWIPAALGAMREARVLAEAAQKATDKGPPKDPPSTVEVLAAVARDEMTSSAGVDAIADEETTKREAQPRTMLAALLAFAFLLTGCGSALSSAVQVANYASVAGNEAQAIVHDKCTAPMVALASEPASPERVLKAKALATNCDKIEDAYDAFRRVHLALVSALMRAQTDNGITVGELLAVTDEVMQSLIQIEKTIRAQNGGAK